MKITVTDIREERETLILTVDYHDIPPLDETSEDKYLKDFTLYVPLAAIGSRMLMYELDSQEEALQAIICEHGFSLSPNIDTPETKVDAVKTYHTRKGKVKIEGLPKIKAAVERNSTVINTAKMLREE